MPNAGAGDTRAVSEVIGFVLVFSLILGTISIVYVGGFAGLDETRNAERINNAERAFDVLANNFQQMGRGEAPNRATEIKLADAQLRTTDERQIEVNVTNDDDVVTAAKSVAIRYDTEGDSSIVYENGAVIRVDGESAIMKREPDFLFSDDGDVVIRYIALKGADQGTGGSATTVLVRAERRSTFVNNSDTTTDIGIAMETHPDRADVWADYFEGQIDQAAASSTWGSCAVNETHGGPDLARVECDEFDTNRLAVARVTVDVTLA